MTTETPITAINAIAAAIGPNAKKPTIPAQIAIANIAPPNMALIAEGHS
jgi:hypothetical protein